LVMPVGPNVDPNRLAGLRENAIVVARAPQIEILKRAALCITHAGLNTVLETLANGVPIVAIPVTNDQPGVAARVAHTETGRFVPAQQVTAENLAELVHEVLGDSTYGQNALRLSKAITARGGLTLAAQLIEQAFGIKPDVALVSGRRGLEEVSTR